MLNQEVKFAQAFTTCREIASWVSELGMAEFRVKLDFLYALLGKWKAGIIYGVF